jgi:hypothetical protein
MAGYLLFLGVLVAGLLTVVLAWLLMKRDDRQPQREPSPELRSTR